MKIKRALLSVYDKTGIVDFAKSLSIFGVEIISTGGTYKILKENKIAVKEVSEIANFPEILDGRVKTLHPRIHGGILAKRNKKHLTELKKHRIDTIDIVVVNLYPFEKVVSEKNVGRSEIIENIDIGGVTLLRAAAKNFENVIVICDPSDYKEVMEKIKINKISPEFRKSLAAKAFGHTAYYDSLIADYFNEEVFPLKKHIGLELVSKLRYGENPHQKAAIYSQRSEVRGQRSEIKQLQGKELSYNNYLDIDAAYNLVCEFKEPTCVIVKHNNPCGVASSENLTDAYKKAFACDTVSAFGGIVAFNKTVDKKTAEEVIKIFTECIIAPSYDKNALKVFSQKKDIRILTQPLVKFPQNSIEIRKIFTGVLIQESDIKNFEMLKIVTKKKPTKEELKSLQFAFIVAKYVKSNAIVLAFDTQTVGIGAGQMSRIDALKIATSKMTSALLSMKLSEKPNLVLASDAFFPFDDVVRESAKIGVKSIIQPGGSIKDSASIAACDELGISMVFAGTRHFRH